MYRRGLYTSSRFVAESQSVNRSSVHLIKQTQGSLSSLSTGLFHVLVDISINLSQ